MTRGQNDLMMDSSSDAMNSSRQELSLPKASDLIVLEASAEEEQLHLQMLESIAKSSKKTPTWMQ